LGDPLRDHVISQTSIASAYARARLRSAQSSVIRRPSAFVNNFVGLGSVSCAP